MRIVVSLWMVLFLLAHGTCRPITAEEPPAFPEVQLLKTPAGVAFAILGEKPAKPAPTLIVFGGDMRGSLLAEDGNRIGRVLIPHGYLSVSIDVPAHGGDTRAGEKSGDLTEWKHRIVKGENLAGECATRLSKVLDHLIAEKYTDPAQIAVAGTSRGGFVAIHCAAADARIKQVIAFAPVTHLPALREFAGAETDEKVLAQSVIHVADKLVGRPMLIFMGNDDTRVSTTDCIAFSLDVVKKSKGKINPIPVELRIVGTIDHRLHASPMSQYGQLCAPHDEAAAWLLRQRP